MAAKECYLLLQELIRFLQVVVVAVADMILLVPLATVETVAAETVLLEVALMAAIDLQKVAN
tara:strand:- start:178 stop:363 length:186 start_codon:yes stop_codon:yes gene_type:complete